jgi:serralysin
MADASLVNAALGIDASLDIATVDPVAGKGDGGINDYLYEKGNQLTVLAYALQNITNNLNTTTDTTQDYFKAIAEELDTEYAATETRVNIETEAFITKVLNNVVNIKSLTLDDTNKANAIAALAAVLPLMQVKASDSNTTAIFDFATSTLQTDAQALANGSASAATVTSYQTDILNYVADDQNVVADELVPDISALPDSVTIDEDSSVDVAVLANDSYNTTSSIDVVLDTSPSDGSASLSNNVVSYVPDANFFGSDEIAYTITQGDKTSSSSVAISINSINDAPTFDNLLSTYTVDENQTAVTSISVSDIEDEPLTISISGTDEASFNLSSSDVLTFATSPDYETQSSYALVVSVTDGIDTLNKDLTVNLNNLNDNLPVFTSSSSFSADENQTAIGVVVASDADGDSVTYSASGSDILIDSGTGVITFSSAPDYETKTSFTSTVTATDGLNSSTQDITIAVNNLNDNFPELVSIPTFTINENEI